MIERVGGATWEEQVRTRFFEPLGMTRSRCEVRDTELEDVSKGFAMSNGKLVEVPRRNLDALGPAGSIESSANDVSRWIAFHLRHARAELSEEEIEIELTGVNAQYALAYPTADRVGYGLGWFVLVRKGLIVIEHGGGIDGFSSVIGFVPELETGYVILQNTESQDSVLAMAIREHLLDRLTGEKLGDWGPNDMGIRGQTLILKEDPGGPGD